ncbi:MULTISPECIES: hypothetical protein [Sphingobacterium]|jgi:hypothetical protein|uniref:hypothetical protein n=1 Tax=Sphingobacterium TaxID=28453 RepID=UPI00129CD50A|nr:MULTISPECIES: hypothetical protein [Sphingobacterium]MBB1643038.1 hypothetical protein [Sphingobacterium sp. UME9]
MKKINKEQLEVACQNTTDHFKDFFKNLNDLPFSRMDKYVSSLNGYFNEAPKFKKLPQEVRDFFYDECDKLGSN